MSANPEKKYWDACIFFAWLNNEEDIHGVAVIDGIAAMAKLYDDGKIVLMSSLITKTEVFDHKLKTQYARDEFSRRFQRDNFSWILVDERVTDLSRKIGDFHARKGGDHPGRQRLRSSSKRHYLYGADGAGHA